MATNDKYNIHSDFQKFPVINIKFNSLMMGIFNTMLKVSRVMQKRSYDLNVEKVTTKAVDGYPVKLIVMTPHNVKAKAPALVYYHGGGFGMTYSSMHLENAERYANETGCISIFVQYRLMPKHPFPNGFDDSYAALQWTVDNAEKLGIDKQHIVVGGDSAGGAMAAGASQKARDTNLVKLCGQLLIYPVLDHSCSTPSATNFTDVPLWNANSNRGMWDTYLKRYAKDDLPDYAAPGHGNLAALPLTYIETAEFDPLRDEDHMYAEALRALGNEPIMNETFGTIHGYDGNGNSAISKSSMVKRIEFLKQAFGQV